MVNGQFVSLIFVNPFITLSSLRFLRIQVGKHLIDHSQLTIDHSIDAFNNVIQHKKANYQFQKRTKKKADK